VARNWRGGGGEIDLIARLGGRLRLVEVKARPTLARGIEAIDGVKRRRLRRAAEAFLATWRGPLDEVCFALAVVHPGGVSWIDDPFDAC